MDWLPLFIICMNLLLEIQCRYADQPYIRELIDLLRKKQQDNRKYEMLRQYNPYRLPHRSSVPGHTLLKPALTHLKSSVQYPRTDLKNTLVYGNPSNIGIQYGKNNERVSYSDFRRQSDDLLKEMAHLLLDHKQYYHNPKYLIQSKYLTHAHPNPLGNLITESEEAEDAKEVIDVLDPERNFFNNFRKRNSDEKSKEDSEDDSESDEPNPGNPYTIHKNKYKQNWLWNHFMDGDHMNINPYGPKFQNYGPTGHDIFWNRKWWYFNQDDYKPMN